MERRRCLPLALGDWGSVLAKVRETNDEGFLGNQTMKILATASPSLLRAWVFSASLGFIDIFAVK